MIEYPYEYGRGRNKESFMYRNIEKSTVMVLKDQIHYQDGQIVSKTLVQNNKISMTLFSFEKGEEISTHAAGGDAMVIVLEGTGRFTVDGVEYLVSEGQSIIMPKDIPHAVYGQERFKMLLLFPSKSGFLTRSQRTYARRQKAALLCEAGEAHIPVRASQGSRKK